MQALIDADVLRYEIGFAAEAAHKEDGPPSFDYVADLLDMRIKNICAEANATEEPILYMTGATNFRYSIAKTTPYKQRTGLKPFHWRNLTAYMKAKYNVQIQEGLEADDLMAIEQTKRGESTIICTRDKDLRAVPGWHFGWELGNQPQFGPCKVDRLGEVRLSSDRKSLKGTGLLFFYGQCLTGDRVDSVPGLGGCGPVKAYELLREATTEHEALEAVIKAYREVHEDKAEEYLLEQGRLLWMTRELHPDGSPVLWEIPKSEASV